MQWQRSQIQKRKKYINFKAWANLMIAGVVSVFVVQYIEADSYSYESNRNSHSVRYYSQADVGRILYGSMESKTQQYSSRESDLYYESALNDDFWDLSICLKPICNY
ncbi:MAG: hypothetical protein CMP10_20820 [Zetaproteobacteria bacterium]|nr:hypothetical protein [Pseudobdellovibrionaceae bacterium]